MRNRMVIASANPTETMMLTNTRMWHQPRIWGMYCALFFFGLVYTAFGAGISSGGGGGIYSGGIGGGAGGSGSDGYFGTYGGSGGSGGLVGGGGGGGGGKTSSTHYVYTQTGTDPSGNPIYRWVASSNNDGIVGSSGGAGGHYIGGGGGAGASSSSGNGTTGNGGSGTTNPAKGGDYLWSDLVVDGSGGAGGGGGAGSGSSQSKNPGGGGSGSGTGKPATGGSNASGTVGGNGGTGGSGSITNTNSNSVGGGGGGGGGTLMNSASNITLGNYTGGNGGGGGSGTFTVAGDPIPSNPSADDSRDSGYSIGGGGSGGGGAGLVVLDVSGTVTVGGSSTIKGGNSGNGGGGAGLAILHVDPSDPDVKIVNNGNIIGGTGGAGGGAGVFLVGSSSASPDTPYGTIGTAWGGTLINNNHIEGGNGVLGNNSHIQNSAGATIDGRDLYGAGVHISSNGSGYVSVVENCGDISGSYGVATSGIEGHVINYEGATIYGELHGIQTTAENAVIDNFGDILGDINGIFSSGTNTYINNAYGATITGDIPYPGYSGYTSGIYVSGSDSIVHNEGDISGVSWGVILKGDDNAIYNMETGTITAKNLIGVNMQGERGYLFNVGDILTENGSGVKVTGGCGTIVNTITEDGRAGTITGGTWEEDAGVTLAGLGAALINDSFITGAMGVNITPPDIYGIENGGLAATVLNTVRGEIRGNADTGIGVNMEANASDLSNSGLITANQGVTTSGRYVSITNSRCGVIEGTNVGGVGIDLGGEHGVMKNYGTIRGTEYGTIMSGQEGKIFNASLITGDKTGSLLDGASNYLENRGRIIGTDVGVNVSGEENLVFNAKAGTIQGDTGVHMETDGTIINEGKIYGVSTGVVTSGDKNSQIINNATGEITADDVGVYLTAVVNMDESELDNERIANLYNEGSITGHVAVQTNGQNLAIVNVGRIAGHPLDNDGFGVYFQSDSQDNILVNNAEGTISGYIAVKMEGTGDTAANLGTITGAEYGAELSGNKNQFENYNGGVVTGKTGIHISGTDGRVVNYHGGLIIGEDGAGVTTSGTGAHVVNAGNISGSGDNAVLINGNDSTLELWNGFTFGTDDTGKAVSTGSNNTLALGGAEGTGSAFNAERIDVDFLGFEHFVKLGDAIWDLVGDADSVNQKDWTVKEGGGLVIRDQGIIGNITIDNTGREEDEDDNVFAAFAFDGEYAGSIYGDGDVYKVGGGTVTFTGNSGSFSGTTYVGEGTLALESLLGGDVRVDDGGRFVLEEAGIVGNNVIVASGGDFIGGGTINQDLNVLAGGSISFLQDTGTVTVLGDYNFENDAIMNVYIDHSGKNINSLVEVGGTATMGNGTIYLTGIEVPDDGRVAGVWTIVNAPNGGVDLAGCGPVLVSNTNYLFFKPELFLDDDDTTLNIGMFPKDPDGEIALNLVGKTHNQREAARVLNRYREGKLYNHLLMLGEHNDVLSILDHFTGEVHATARTVAAVRDQRFSEMLRSRSLRLNDDAFYDDNEVDTLLVGSGGEAFATLNPMAWKQRQKTALWAQSDGGGINISSNGNAGRGTVRNLGLAVGVERDVREDLLVGAAFRYSRDKLWMDTRSSSANIDSLQVGGYAANTIEMDRGTLRFTAGATAAIHFVDTDRRIRFNSFSEDLSAKYWSQSAGAFLEVGLATNPFSSVHIEPYLGLDYSWQRTNDIYEKGGSAALGSLSDTRMRLSSTLGVRMIGEITSFLAVDLDAALRTNHDSGDPSMNMYFLESKDKGAMNIYGSNVPRHELKVGVGARIQPWERVDMRVGYDTSIGKRMVEHNGNVSMGMNF